MAPGGEHDKGILSTFTGSDYSEANYGTLFGSSMAAPHVSALAAIAKDKYRDIHVKELEELLKASTTERNIVNIKKFVNNLNDDDFKIGLNDFSNIESRGDYNSSFDSEVSGCGSLDLGSGQGPTSTFSVLIGIVFSCFIFVGRRQFGSIL